MRAALVACALVACTPEVVPDAYQCGPDELCPDGLVCSGSNNTCEDPITAQPFSCADGSAMTGADTVGSAIVIPNLACVSNLVTFDGCLAAGEGQNWFSFTTPADCVAVAVSAEVAAPIAFESIGIAVGDATGAIVAADTPCPLANATEAAACVRATLANATAYTLEVSPDGGGDCGGACNFNRYTLTLQLVTPN